MNIKVHSFVDGTNEEYIRDKLKSLLRRMEQSIILMTIILLIINCQNNPVKPENYSPVIFYLVAFPDVVKPNDSLIVICNAYDPEDDTLVYDWYTSGVVRIKNGDPNFPALYNTYENAQIFYAPDSQFVSAPQDTFRIQCATRDRKGGMDVETIFFLVIKAYWVVVTVAP